MLLMRKFFSSYWGLLRWFELLTTLRLVIIFFLRTKIDPVLVKCIPIYIQQGATLNSLFISGNCSTCFGWYGHPSSEAQTTVSTASGICHTVTATCRYRGRVGTGLSVLRRGWCTPLIAHAQTGSNSSKIAAGNRNDVPNTRCCWYSCMRSWWWVEVLPKICRVIFRYK
jgi:hypothetical protein